LEDGKKIEFSCTREEDAVIGHIQAMEVRDNVMEEAQAHDRRSPSPSLNTSSSFSSSPTNRRSGPTKHH